MENKNHQPLKRIEDGEDILESDSCWTEAKESEQPRDSKQGKDDRRGLDTSFNFLYLRLVLHVPCSHHLSNHQDKHHDVNLRIKQSRSICSSGGSNHKQDCFFTEWFEPKRFSSLSGVFGLEVLVLNPFIPDMKMHILLTVLHTFLMELVRRICLNIKLFYPRWTLSLFYQYLFQHSSDDCKEKFHFRHCKDWKG